MRSHPYTPAPPLPPLLNHLSTYLPNAAGPRRPATAAYDDEYAADDGAVALADLDPATSRLLPRRRPPPRVRVQGRLAVVRSVSVANLGAAPGSPRAPPPPPTSSSSSSSAVSGRIPPPPLHNHDRAIGPRGRQRRRRRRRSLDDGVGGGGDGWSEEDEAAVREVQRKDAQLRSYGIGGAGNIRRPTDVLGTSTREPSALASLFSGSSARSAAEEKKWHWAGFLGRVSERKGKGAAQDGGRRRRPG